LIIKVASLTIGADIYKLIHLVNPVLVHKQVL
jgi:hypothetical protein